MKKKRPIHRYIESIRMRIKISVSIWFSHIQILTIAVENIYKLATFIYYAQMILKLIYLMFAAYSHRECESIAYKIYFRVIRVSKQYLCSIWSLESTKNLIHQTDCKLFIEIKNHSLLCPTVTKNIWRI